jgi:hypothetical protein
LGEDVEMKRVESSAIIDTGRLQFGYGRLDKLKGLLAVVLLDAGRLALNLDGKKGVLIQF